MCSKNKNNKTKHEKLFFTELSYPVKQTFQSVSKLIVKTENMQHKWLNG